MQTTDFKNFNDVLMHNFVQHRETVALAYTDGERNEQFTYRQLSHQVYTVVNYLTTNGFQPDERVLVWMPNCPEAIWADLGVTLAGGILTPLAPDTDLDDVVFVAQQQQAAYIFVQTIEQLTALQAQRAKLPKLRSIVVQAATEAEETGIATFYWMMNFPTQINALGAVHTVREQRSAEATLTILYPTKINDKGTNTRIQRKGVTLTHGNILATATATGARLGIAADKKPMRYPLMLSLNNVEERIMGYYTMLFFAKTMVVAEPVQGRSLSAQVEVTKADILCINSQKVEDWCSALMLTMQDATLAQWALRNGLTVAEQELSGATVSWFMRKKHDFYKKQRTKVKTKHAKTLQTIVTYGTPLQAQTVYFFYALGWNVLQSFGEPETCGFATIDDPTDARPLTAGKALDGLAVEIERYGPIVAKGDTVFKGYYNDAKATANAFDKEGFFQCKTKGHLDNFRLVVAQQIGEGSAVTPKTVENTVVDVSETDAA